MPPQVHKAGGGTATPQPPVSEEQKDAKSTSSSTATSATGNTGSVTASESQAQPQKAQEDPKTAARSHQSSQKHATEKKSQQTMHGQMLQKDLQKKVDKQQTDGLWESMKNVANSVAVESFNKTAQVVDRATADAAMTDAAQKANANVMQGLEKARGIDRQQQVKTISAEADRAAHGQPNPEYKKHMRNPVMTPEFLAERGIYANVKPKFEDSEKVIQKMDQYNRQTSPNDNPKTHLHHQVRTDSMEKLLGPYGYYSTVSGGPEVQKQILDASLHNWQMTPPEARQALHARDKDSPALHGDYTKNWIKPPRTSTSEEERISKNQVVQDPPLPGAYNQPGYQGPRDNRPDPGQVFAKGAYDFRKAGFDVINSIGVTHGTPRHSPRIFEGSSGMVEASHIAPPPERRIDETKPGAANPTRVPGPSTSSAATQSGPAGSVRPEQQKIVISKQSSPATSDKSDAKAESGKKPATINLSRTPQEGWRRNQERRVEDALGRLDPGTLSILRDRLQQEGLIDQQMVNRPKTDPDKIHDPLKGERTRNHQGLNVPGDRERLLRELREAIEKSTDPSVTEVLETDQRGLSVQEELRRLRDTRLEEHLNTRRMRRDYPVE